jgi:hypothetical protein
MSSDTQNMPADVMPAEAGIPDTGHLCVDSCVGPRLRGDDAEHLPRCGIGAAGPNVGP